LAEVCRCGRSSRHQEEAILEPEVLVPPSGKIKTDTEISHWKSEAEEAVDAGKDCEQTSCVEMFLALARKHSLHRVE